MEKGKFIYEGKAKQLYETDDKDLRSKLLEFRKEMKEDFKKNIHVEL